MKFKEIVYLICLFLIVAGVLYVGTIRNEKIDNGEMTLVSESYMSR